MDKQNSTPTGHGNTKSPEAVVRGDNTKKASPKKPASWVGPTEIGSPESYPTDAGDPTSAY